MSSDIVSILSQPKSSSLMQDITELSEENQLTLEKSNQIVEILNTPRTDILSDFPTDKDTLGFNVMVRTLSNIALSESTQTPLTICIDGEWGSGKTSILKMVETQARMLDFSCIWLNAWRLDDVHAFYNEVNNEILREFSLRDESGQELRNQFWEWLQSPSMFGEFIKELLARKRSNSRLLIFIDDIDRAFPDQIMMAFKNLKLILESSGCIFLLAMDAEIVAQSLTKAYINQTTNSSNMNLNISASENARITMAEKIEQNFATNRSEDDFLIKDFGYRYLEKIIQIQVKLPSLTRNTIYAYLKQLNVADEILEIIAIAPDKEVLNPRRLKRYINWLSISLQLIVSLPKHFRFSNLTTLRAIALRHDYPDVYSGLLQGRKNDPIYPNLKNFLSKFSKEELVKVDKFLNETPILNTKRRYI